MALSARRLVEYLTYMSITNYFIKVALLLLHKNRNLGSVELLIFTNLTSGDPRLLLCDPHYSVNDSRHSAA